MGAFERLAPPLKEYIYRHGWRELRAAQVAACEVLFDTQDDLLLSSGTASGKTEAAFLPALTLLMQRPSASVGILYIAPLKALINDQFVRLTDLLEACEIPVCKWHGDARATGKRRVMAHPQGVLQITPESLEGLLMNRRTESRAMFADLRFVVIDEVHAFMGSPRGVQLLCQLERIQALCGCRPRRIGLSATLQDLCAAKAWLSTGSGRACAAPLVAGVRKRMRLRMEWFAPEDAQPPGAPGSPDSPDAPDEGPPSAYDLCLYERTLHKQAIVFANSRAQAERVAARLKRAAAHFRTPDCYRVHHGSVSAALREEVEREMKQDALPVVTAATLTLELGIDIGSLDAIVQLGAPLSVSSLVQRIGRCGRRGQQAELLFPLLAAEAQDPQGLDAIQWELVKTLAMLSLYLTERWIEPAGLPRLPYAIAFHQTISCLYARGELSAGHLAQAVLTLTPLAGLPKDDYVLLLRHMLEGECLARSERGGLMLGAEGERVARGYEFFSVFESPREFAVQCGGEQIGTVMRALPVGERFALAGRAWQVEEVDEAAGTLFVREAAGSAQGLWESSFQAPMHGRVLARMRDILRGADAFPWMSARCAQALSHTRDLARALGAADAFIVPAGAHSFALFPWLGSARLYALRHALAQAGLSPAIAPSELTPVYLTVALPPSQAGAWDDAQAQARNRARLLAALARIAADEGPIPLPEDAQVPGKYNEYVPKALLRKQYEADFLDVPGMRASLAALLRAEGV